MFKRIPFLSKKTPLAHSPLVKTAAKKEEDNSSKSLLKILAIICLSLSGWALNATYNLSVRVSTEEAVRVEQIKVLNERVKTLKEDSEKKFTEYRVDSDRRFSEIKKDLENLNTKMDVLVRKSSQ